MNILIAILLFLSCFVVIEYFSNNETLARKELISFLCLCFIVTNFIIPIFNDDDTPVDEPIILTYEKVPISINDYQIARDCINHIQEDAWYVPHFKEYKINFAIKEKEAEFKTYIPTTVILKPGTQAIVTVNGEEWSIDRDGSIKSPKGTNNIPEGSVVRIRIIDNSTILDSIKPMGAFEIFDL